MSKKSKKQNKARAAQMVQSYKLNIGLTTPNITAQAGFPLWYSSILQRVLDTDRQNLMLTPVGISSIRLYVPGESYPQDLVATHTLVTNLIPDYRARGFWDEARQMIVGIFIDLDNDPEENYANNFLYGQFMSHLDPLLLSQQMYQFIKKYKSQGGVLPVNRST